MALVEAVAGKLLNQAKELFGLLGPEPLLLRAGDKLFAEGSDGLELLLADRLDAGIRLGELDAAKPLEDSHHLLLVDHHPVGLCEHILHHRMRILRRLAAVLHRHVVVDHAAFERTRTVEGVDGHDVEEAVGLHPLQQVADAAALQLEDAFGLAAAEQVESGLVVQGERVGIGLGAGGVFDDLDRLREHRQIPQAEEVHLHQPSAFDVVHRPLGDHFLFARHPLQRHIFHQRPIGNHDRRRVRADVAGQAFDAASQVDELTDLRVTLAERGQLAAGRGRLGDRDAQLIGHEGHHGVDAGNRHAQRPADIADRRPGRQRAEGADLGDVGLAILPLHIVNHLAAAIFAEVDVDIGRFQAVDVEEAFEEQVVFQRADVRHVERVGNERSHARSSGTGGNAAVAGVPDEVPDDQEVGREAEGVDHAELAVEPLNHQRVELVGGPLCIGQVGGGRIAPPLGNAAIPLAEALQAEPLQLFRRGQAAGHLKAGEVSLAQVELEIDRLGDLLAPLQQVAAAPHRLEHFLGALQVKLARLHPHPRGVVAEAAGVDAQQDVLGFGVFPIDVVAVAGGNSRDARLLSHAQGGLGDLLLDLEAVALHLDEIPIIKHLLKPAGDLVGLGELLLLAGANADQRTGKLAGEAAGEADQALRTLREDLAVDAGLKVEALQRRGGGELEQVLKAGSVLGQQREVVARLLLAAGVFLEAAAGSDIGLVAHDRVDARPFAGLIKLERSMQVAVVGERQRVHPQLSGPLDQLFDLAGPV